MSRQSTQKYNQLMQTAEKLFIERGFKAVSVDEIAEAAQISKMTLYSHFKSKEQLFLKVIINIMDRQFGRIQNDLVKHTGTLDKINYMVHYSLESVQQYSLEFYTDTLALPQVLETVTKEKNKRVKALFLGIIKEGMEKGDIRRGDSEIFVDTLITLMEVMGTKYFNKVHSKKDIDAMIQELFDILKYGLLGGTGVNNNG